MAIPLKINQGLVMQLDPADPVAADSVLPRTGTTLVIGDLTTTTNAPGRLVAGTVEVEIDFGSTPSWGADFEIVDAGVSVSSKIFPSQSSKPATGRVGNDTAWDQLLLSAVAANGSFVLTAMPLPGPVVGRRTIQYQIGS